MNVLPREQALDPRLWETPQMREALARHDIGRVFALLRRSGVSQRQIAARTDLHQSEVSAITRGREVQAYQVLARIADGLGIPRGYMGLAYAGGTAAPLPCSPCSDSVKDGPVRRRELLGIVGKLVVGSALTSADITLISTDPQPTPVPARLGAAEVDQLRSLTAGLRAYDIAHGGGSCREAILAHSRWAESLLGADCTDPIRRQLLAAVAEARTLAGWTAHDLGLTTEAYSHLVRAVEHTRAAGDPAHTAIVLHYLGRVPLDNGDPDEALKYFQLGQIAAQDAHSPLAVAFLHANQAVAYAHQGHPDHAISSLRRAENEFAHAGTDEQDRPFARFFDHTALETAAARVHSHLGLHDPAHRDQAIIRLRRTLDHTPADHARQRAFNLTWLATCTLAAGDPDTGTQLGHQALDAVRAVNSTRLLHHLAPLATETAHHRHNSDVNDLAHEVHLLRSTAA
ncbi:transcriptional regulator with XRE-family HTH domain/tetratricopeptide (TPR) repeat protein [Saccharothrix coeruleofusca]|uniref:helix-turn-helix domain-containing protein n=1 Tax=Saccharothrix coeruleofusca TaxID=33919 RepID=UPI001AE14C04|nr:helix-turn-helix domain-containing protein [Saccharothrix coeruleofusca]MBP2337287.1 transcriptional regulator with XRE-family HTH domain/tetratricopeptide (TPR) repeat protein [Saccharothrix coeruleofusca]